MSKIVLKPYRSGKRSKKNKKNLFRICSLVLIIVMLCSIILVKPQEAKADVSYNYSTYFYPAWNQFQTNKYTGTTTYQSYDWKTKDKTGNAECNLYQISYKNGTNIERKTYFSGASNGYQGGYECAIWFPYDGGGYYWYGSPYYHNGSETGANRGTYTHFSYYNIELADINIKDITIGSQNFVQVNITLKNTGNEERAFHFSTTSDIQVAGDDNSYVQKNPNGFTLSNSFSSDCEKYEGPIESTSLNYITSGIPGYVTDASAVWLGPYQDRLIELNAAYNGIILKNNDGELNEKLNEEYHSPEHNSTYTDVGMSIQWHDIWLSGGQSRTFSYLIGVGNGEFSYLTGKYDNGYDSVEGINLTYDKGSTAKTYFRLKNGYHFDYVKDLNNGTIYTSIDEAPNCITWNMSTDRNVAYYSKPNTYKLTFDLQGGSIDMTKPHNLYSPAYTNSNYVNVTYDSVDYSQMEVPVKEGYTFLGYYSSDTGGIPVYNAEGKAVDSNGYWTNYHWKGLSDKTVYARWTTKQTVDRIYTQASSDGKGYYAYCYVNWNEKTPSKVQFPTWSVRKEQDDLKWYETSTSGTYYKIIDGESKLFNYRYYVPFTDTNRNNELGIYATFVYAHSTDSDYAMARAFFTKTFMISLNQYGGSGGTTAIYERYDNDGYKEDGVNYLGGYFATADEANWRNYNLHNDNLDKMITKITIPTRTGYTFKGYYTESNGKGTQYINERGDILAKYNTFTSTTTLYADWSPDVANYTVNHFYQKADGTYNSIADETVSDVGTINDTITAPYSTKINYTTDYIKPTAQTLIITADGTTTVNYYYPRVQYTLTLAKDSNISSVSGAGTYRWGQTVNITAVLNTNTVQYTYGWSQWNSNNTSLIGNVATQNTTITMPKGNITLTAIGTQTINSYKQIVQVRYENADGTFTNYQDVINTNYNYGATVTWSRAADVTYKAASLTSYTVTGIKTTQITIYRNKYTVTYDYKTNGGTTATKSTDTKRSGDIIDLTPTASKSGWTFIGWNTNKDATVGLSSYTMPTSNTTLYAIYSKTIVATFKDYDTSLKTHQISNTIYNNATGVTITIPTGLLCYGWTWRGWSASGDTKGNAEIAYNNGEKITITSNNTYYGLYSSPLLLSYNSNGGLPTPVTQTAMQYWSASYTYVHPTLTLANAINRTGYIFNGWGKDSITGDTYKANSNICITNHTIMYAKWNAIEYTIKYNSNIPTTTAIMEGTMTNSSHTYDIEKALNSNNYSIAGYIFNGWTDNNGHTYTNGQVVKNLTTTNGAIINLYAQWIARTDTQYKVEHYQQNLIDNNYTLKDTETFKGTTDNKVTPSVKTYEGFTSPTTQTVIIRADGTTVVKYYYTRNSYYFNLDGYLDFKSIGNITNYGSCDIYINGVLVADNCTDFNKSYKYGTTYEIKDIQTISGKTYGGIYSGLIKGTIGVNGNTTILSYCSKPTIIKTITKQDYNKGYYVYMYVQDNGGGINKVQLPTWTQNKGQDDIFNNWATVNTCTATKQNNTIDGQTYNYVYYVDVSKHNNEYGLYNTHIYAYDKYNGYNTSILTQKFTFTITFNYNKPSNATSNINNNTITSKNVIYGERYGDLPNPTLTGWIFEGWYSDTNYTTKITNTSIYSVGGNSILYAKWRPIEYTVNLYPGDTPNAMTPVSHSNTLTEWEWETNHWSKKFTYDKLETIPEVNKAYSLKGWINTNVWYKENACINSINSGEKKWNLTTVNSSIVNLYIKWTDEKPTISISSTNTQLSSTQKVTFILTDIGSGIKGYYFGQNSDYTKNTYYPTEKLEIINKTETISNSGIYYITAFDYAGNKISNNISYCITTFNANTKDYSKATVNTLKTITCYKIGDIYTNNSFIFPQANQKGYHGETQQNQSNISTTWSLDNKSNISGNTRGMSVVNGNTQLIPIKDETYYAVWIANTYTIRLDKNKPNNATNEVICNTDKYIMTYGTTNNNSIIKPTLIGWDNFEGWYESKNGGNKIYNGQLSTSLNTMVTNTDNEIYWNNGKWIYDGDITLYAHWIANTYKVILKSNRPINPKAASATIETLQPLGWTIGTETINGQIAPYYTKVFTYDTDSILPEVVGIKESNNNSTFYLHGWSTLGWYTNENNNENDIINHRDSGKKKHNFTIINNDTYILYAHWSENEYIVNYDTTGGTKVNKDTVLYEEKIKLPSTIRPGYTFIEWRDDKNNSYKDELAIKDFIDIKNNDKILNIILTAFWEKKKVVCISSLSSSSTSLDKQTNSPLNENNINSLASSIDKEWNNQYITNINNDTINVIQEYIVTKNGIENTK